MLFKKSVEGRYYSIYYIGMVKLEGKNIILKNIMFLSNAHWYQTKCQLKNHIPTQIIASHIGKDCHLATKLAFRLVEPPSTRIGTRVSE